MSSIIEDLAKIGVSNYKQRHDKFLKEMSEKIKYEVHRQILDAMLGPDWSDK